MAHPMDTLVTAQPELVRKQPLLGICFSVPVLEERMIAFCQSGMTQTLQCMLTTLEAVRAATLQCNATADSCQPSVAAA